MLLRIHVNRLLTLLCEFLYGMWMVGSSALFQLIHERRAALLSKHRHPQSSWWPNSGELFAQLCVTCSSCSTILSYSLGWPYWWYMYSIICRRLKLKLSPFLHTQYNSKIAGFFMFFSLKWALVTDFGSWIWSLLFFLMQSLSDALCLL